MPRMYGVGQRSVKLGDLGCRPCMGHRPVKREDVRCTPRVALVCCVAMVAFVGLVCYAKSLDNENESSFRRTCQRDSLDVFEGLEFFEAFQLYVIRCGDRVFRRYV